MAPFSKCSKGGWLVLIVYTVLSAVFCSNYFNWTHLESHAMQEGDPALNAWTLQWVSRSITNDPLNLFNGNAFHPAANSIALSEHMFSLGLINTLFRPFSESPWFGYNLLIFLSYLLSSLGAYKLISYISGSRLTGFWAGIFWGFLYFRVHHISHLQILSFQWIPYTVYFLLRYIKTGNNRSAIGLVFFFVLQALVSWYLAVINTFISIFLFAGATGKHFWVKARWRKHILVLLVIGIILTPFILPYLNMKETFSLYDRMNNTLISGDNVHLIDYLCPPIGTLIGSKIPDNPYWIWQENTLYLGYIPLLLSLFFIVFHLLKSRKIIFLQSGLTTSRILFIGSILCIGGYIMAKGFISGEWNLRLPLSYLANAFPFLAGMRATQRFSLMIYFGIMLLSSLGLHMLLMKIKSKKHLYILVAAFCALYIIEVYPYHIPVNPNKEFSYSKLDYEILKIQSEQRRHPLVILYLPIFYFYESRPIEETTYMVGSTLHWAKIVNGISGLPNSFGERMMTLNTFPSLISIKLLKELDVDYVALDKRLPFDSRSRIIKDVKRQRIGRIVSVSDDEQLIELDKSFVISPEKNVSSLPIFLDFSREYPVTFIALGFSLREDWGRWTNGETAVIKLKGLLPDSFKLVLEGFAFGPNAGQPVKIKIGNSEKSISLPNQKSIVSLDFSGVKDAESIVIQVPKPISPHELGISGDKRELGIGIMSMKIF